MEKIDKEMQFKIFFFCEYTLKGATTMPKLHHMLN